MGCTVIGTEWQCLLNALRTTWEGFVGDLQQCCCVMMFSYQNIIFSYSAGIMFGLVVKVWWNILSFQAADQKVVTKESQRKLIVLKPLIQALLHSVNLGREGELSMGPNNKEYVSCLWIEFINDCLKWKRDEIQVYEFLKPVGGSANLTGLDLFGEKKDRPMSRNRNQLTFRGMHLCCKQGRC